MLSKTHNQKPSYGTKHITNIKYIKQDLSTHIKQDKRSVAFYGPIICQFKGVHNSCLFVAGVNLAWYYFHSFIMRTCQNYTSFKILECMFDRTMDKRAVPQQGKRYMSNNGKKK